MTAADQIAADLRDAFRRIEPPHVPVAQYGATLAMRAVREANDFDSPLTRPPAAIVPRVQAEATAPP